MKKPAYILTVALLSFFLLNINEISAEKPLHHSKGNLHLSKSSYNSSYKTMGHNTHASNQRVSRYSTGKRENVFQRSFQRKNRFNKPPKGHENLV